MKFVKQHGWCFAFVPMLGDPTGEKLIASMQESGIDLTVICLLKNLPSDAPPGSVFTQYEVQAILGGNAAALLGLDS